MLRGGRGAAARARVGTCFPADCAAPLSSAPHGPPLSPVGCPIYPQNSRKLSPKYPPVVRFSCRGGGTFLHRFRALAPQDASTLWSTPIWQWRILAIDGDPVLELTEQDKADIVAYMKILP